MVGKAIHSGQRHGYVALVTKESINDSGTGGAASAAVVVRIRETISGIHGQSGIAVGA